MEGIHFDVFDELYAQQWVSEEEAWFRRGLYTHTLSFLGYMPNEQRHHIDLGSGFGTLLHLLCPDELPGDRVMGVDNNSILSFAALRSLRARNPKRGVVFAGETYTEETGVGYRRKFLTAQDDDLQLLRDFEGFPGIRLIIDDIRSMEFVKMVIDNTKFKTGSFLMPGTSQRVVAEEGIMGVKQDVYEVLGRVMRDVRMSAYSFFSKYIETKGRIVVADRLFLPEGEMKSFDFAELKRFVYASIADILGFHGNCWEVVGDLRILSMEDAEIVQGNIPWVKQKDKTSGEAPEMYDSNTHVKNSLAYVLSLSRNNTPYIGQ
jgi:hypothetical protein